MLDFTTVSREFRSLVDRRREIQTFLGSGFAAMSLVMVNALEGKLPPSLQQIQDHLFAFYAFVLMVLSLLLALRMARLHGGMILNGILYARLLQAAGHAKADPKRAARPNLLGVSFLQFVLDDLLAGFSAAVLLVSLELSLGLAIAAGAGVFALWLVLYFWFYGKAVRLAHAIMRTHEAGPVAPEALKEHVSLSMQQANQGMIGEIAFAGLIVFSCFGTLSGLGKIEAGQLDIAPDFVREKGPIWFAGLMTVTCLFQLVIYLRVRIAIGKFSLQLDPSDRPFRPLRLTDSLLGYLLLAFLFVVSLHVLLVQVLPGVHTNVILAVDASAYVALMLVEQTMLVVAGRRAR